MKVLLVNKFFYKKGGSETVLFQERDFLKNNNVEIIDFSMKDIRNEKSKFSEFFIPFQELNVDPGSYINIHKIKTLKNSIGFISNNEASQKLEKLLIRTKPNIAHLHNIYHQITPSILPVLKKYRIKTIMTLHDYKLVCPIYIMLRNGRLCNECRGRNFWNVVRYKCKDNIFLKSFLLSVEAYYHKLKESYEQIDLYIAPSNFMKKTIGDRITRKKIVVLKNGVDTQAINASYLDHNYILFFGRISKEKGVETLIKAYKNMIKDKTFKYPSLKIVGDGPLLGKLDKKEKGIEFIGKKDGEELKMLVAHSSFVVVPSEWNENCSMVVLEAMAHGKAIVAAKIGGLPEQVQDNFNGLLFKAGDIKELSDKLSYLANNRKARESMGINSRKKVIDEFDIKVHCHKLLNIYHNVLEQY
jgi:glycosyltransferase involved in cell wall biosynthesis